MTSIKDLETQIEGVGRVLSVLRDGLDELKANIKELKEQEQPEPESLFGRWATLPKHGRGIITSIKPDSNGEVRFIYRNESFTDSTEWLFASVEHLTLDPATLNTAKDFNDAPEGTIAEIMVEPKDVYVKKDNVWFGAGEEYPTPVQSLAKARVIRWGNGK
ncbi:hypothetical protein [uncultured Corynebacterium sp.]|uniref:hypothetical protein n=1 Tax=uncultured Corynebacterium sp. TaxID=159447 RepID=UPI00259A6E18|nr:hypothetical protein [uncultured Corynebacterium sp.]